MRRLLTTVLLCSLVGCGTSPAPPAVMPVTTGAQPTTSGPATGLSSGTAAPAVLPTVVLEKGDTKEEDRKPLPQFGYSIRPPAGFEPFKGPSASTFSPPGSKPASILTFMIDGDSGSAMLQLTQRTTEQTPQEDLDKIEKSLIGDAQTIAEAEFKLEADPGVRWEYVAFGNTRCVTYIVRHDDQACVIRATISPGETDEKRIIKLAELCDHFVASIRFDLKDDEQAPSQ